MTHEELLAKLKPTNTPFPIYSPNSVVNALVAVVERHFPNGTCSDPECNPKHLWCNCGNEYPCEDIQAIEKELK